MKLLQILYKNLLQKVGQFSGNPGQAVSRKQLSLFITKCFKFFCKTNQVKYKFIRY